MRESGREIEKRTLANKSIKSLEEEEDEIIFDLRKLNRNDFYNKRDFY